MDKYLIEILKEVNTIIIPDLGALTIVNHATGEIMFMPYLKFDDGKLTQHIAEKEGWEENEAKNLIAKYVREVRAKLDQGETYDIYRVGSFFKNAEGEVDFRADATAAGEPTEDSTPEVKASAPVVEEKEPIAEPAPEPEKEPETAVVEEVKEEVKVEEPAPVQEAKIEVIESHVETVTEKSETKPEPAPLSEEAQWKDDLDVPPINHKKKTPKKPILEKTEKDKKKKKRGAGFYILIALLALLAGGGTYFGLNYNELKQYVPFLADKEVSKEDTSEEENASDSNEEDYMSDAEGQEEQSPDMEETNEDTNEEVVEPTPEVKQEVAAPVTHSGGLHVDKSLPVQVIIGSFAEESNAKGLVQQLTSQGHAAEIIGQYDFLYLVSIASFQNNAEFNAQKSAVVQVSDKYWVFRK